MTQKPAEELSNEIKDLKDELLEAQFEITAVQQKNDEIEKEVERLMDSKYEPFREQMNKQDDKILALTQKLRVAEKALDAIANRQPGFGGMPEVWDRKVAKEALSKLREESEK